MGRGGFRSVALTKLGPAWMHAEIRPEQVHLECKPDANSTLKARSGKMCLKLLGLAYLGGYRKAGEQAVGDIAQQKLAEMGKMGVTDYQKREAGTHAPGRSRSVDRFFHVFFSDSRGPRFGSVPDSGRDASTGPRGLGSFY